MYNLHCENQGRTEKISGPTHRRALSIGASPFGITLLRDMPHTVQLRDSVGVRLVEPSCIGSGGGSTSARERHGTLVECQSCSMFTSVQNSRVLAAT